MAIQSYIREQLDAIDYKAMGTSYIPSKFAMEFVNFIKSVNADSPEENLTPTIHYKLAESYGGRHKEIANMLFRGSAKTTSTEYLILFIAAFGGLPFIGEINLALFLGANKKACEQFKNNLEGRIEQSAYLKDLIKPPKMKIDKWEFVNIEGKKLIINSGGIQTSIRGSRSIKDRPSLAILDDIIDADDANSAIINEKAFNAATSALRPAMHPTKYKIIWNGTPYNSRDPLYRAIESRAWKANVYPIAEKFPCEREEFAGAWTDRFSYDTIKEKHKKFELEDNLEGFYAEYMIDIASAESRLIKDKDIKWFNLKKQSPILLKSAIYITTDFATSEKEHADFSTINIWSYANIDGTFKWYWLDGFCEKANMNTNIDKLFEFVKTYKPYQVGIEVSGQQGGFISWILREQRLRKLYFNFAKGKTPNVYHTSDSLGLNPSVDKFSRFLINAVPLFKTGKIYFPLELSKTESLTEFVDELNGVTYSGFKSLHDDQLDNASMLGEFSLLERVVNKIEIPVETEFKRDTNIFNIPTNTDSISAYDIV